MLSVPRPVQPGDLVRVVAPSGCFDRDAFITGLAYLERAGLRVSYEEGVLSRRLYLAGDDDRRARELEAALADPLVRVIWSARGGYGATRLLPRLDVARVRAAGRWLVGFSDATALHAVWGRAGLASIHGANVTTLASWSDAARGELFALLAGAPSSSYPGTVLRGGPCARGRLLGGNLTTLASMAGTGALPSAEGAILFLEDVGERPYRLDRSLTQLRQAGALEGVRGIAIGQLTGCDEANNPDIQALGGIAEALAGLRIPVLTGLPLGHEPSSRAVLLGGLAELDPEAATLTVAATSSVEPAHL